MTSIERDTATNKNVTLNPGAIHRAIEDLRTPLTVIRGHGQLLRRRLLQRRFANDDLLTSLAAIEIASVALETRLRALADQARES